MKEIKFLIEQRIEKADEKKFFRLPLDLPAGVERLDVSYSYKGDYANSNATSQKNVIDLAFVGKNGEDIGTRGSFVQAFHVSAHDSSSGFKCVELAEGRYFVVLGAYLVRQEGVTVRVDATVGLKEPRFFAGDLHCHSNNSDGNLSPDALARKAKRKGLSFVAVTDHNNNLVGVPLPRLNDFQLIEGLEFTNYKGHVGLLGRLAPYSSSFAVTDEADFARIMHEAEASGAIICLNHPRCSLCPLVFDAQCFPYHAVEVWNGYMRADNLKAVEMWDADLRAGKKTVAVAGSDFHKNIAGIIPALARPTTHVFADSLAKSDLSEAIRAGRTVFTAKPKSTFLNITAGDAVVGGTAKLAECASVTVSAKGLRRGHSVVLIGKNGVFFEHIAKRKGDFEQKVPINEAGYVRAEVRYAKRGLSRLAHKLLFTTILKFEPKGKLPKFIHAITNAIWFV